VDIREALGGAAGYSHSEGKQQEAQQHLWSIARERPPDSPLVFASESAAAARAFRSCPGLPC
jgi:hypothetical protein